MTLHFNKLFSSDTLTKLKKFLNPETPSFTAINIGSRYLKGLIIEAGEIAGYFTENSSDLSAAVNQVFAESKAPPAVKISLKNQACLVRYFSFPKMDRKKQQQALFYEMNKFIPFSPEEVYFDFFTLKEITPAEDFLLLAVAKKKFIDPILEVFDKAKLTISQISLDSICLLNLFSRNYPDSKNTNACILDLGYNFSIMSIVGKGFPFLTRDVKFSTKDILQVVSRLKNFPLDKAENWLFSLKDKSEFLELIKGSIAHLCQEMKSSFDYFEVNKGEQLDRVYLTGGLASVEGIENIFSELLETDTSILEVFPQESAGFAQNVFDQKFKHFKNSLSAAAGLAI